MDTHHERPRAGLRERLADELGLDTAVMPPPPRPVPLSSRLAVGGLAWWSVSAAGAALSGGGSSQPDPDAIAAAFRSDRHLLIDGVHPDPWSPLSGFWRTADGWLRTHGNYPHHAAALRSALGLTPDADAEAVGAALQTTASGTAEAAIRAAGGVAVTVRREDPAADAALRQHPLIDVTRIGDSEAQPLPRSTAAAPLAGVRVLDLTRVLAGPIATRTLAYAGADVLRVDPPQLLEPEWQHLDTGHGKRSALLDIAADRPRFDALLASADVVVLGYRPSGLRRLGLTPRMLATQHPHLIVAQLSAWPGKDSPRGFDSIVQADSGISWIESSAGDVPGAMPAQALDHSAGYLLAAGVATALRRRAEDGGAWLVRTSLRRVAAELLGMPRSAPAPAAEGPPVTQSFDVGGRQVTTVGPAVRWPGSPDSFAALRPWGADPAEW